MEKPEYFIIRPSIKTFGGIIVHKDTEFETYNDDKTIHQILKKCKLVTICKKKSEYNGIKSEERSKLVTEVPEGTILIWGEDTGYIIPNYVMVKPKEALKMIDSIKDITEEVEIANNEVVERGE
nr:MAG TPA: hypothetical protein [Caudoviricetes sp.]